MVRGRPFGEQARRFSDLFAIWRNSASQTVYAECATTSGVAADSDVKLTSGWLWGRKLRWPPLVCALPSSVIEVFPNASIGSIGSRVMPVLTALFTLVEGLVESIRDPVGGRWYHAQYCVTSQPRLQV